MKIKYYISIAITISFLSSCITQKQIDLLKDDKSKLYPVSYNGKWGYANEVGELIIPCKFDTVKFFNYGLSAVKYNDKYGFLKTNGDWHIKPKYDYASNFGPNCAEVVKNGIKKRINWRNKKCKIITINQGGCGSLVERTKKETYSIKKDGKYAIVSQIYLKEPLSNGFKIQKDTTDYIFDEVIEFSFEKLLVRKNDKYGFFDVNNMDNLKIVAEEYEVYEVKNGYSLDSIKFQFDEFKIEYETYGGNQNKYEVGNTPFRIDKYWGIISSHGQIILPANYLDVEIATWKLAKVEFEENKFGYVDFYKRKEYFKR